MQVLVTGGAGMLGRAIVGQLLARGDTVRVLDIQPSPLDDARVEWCEGSLTDAAFVAHACEGVDAVIHTASLISQALGKPPALYDVNVTGTEHIIAACQQQNIPKLVYTSSIDVVFDGSPIVAGDETLPYPDNHLDYYGTTKMHAEQAVLAANGNDGLATAAIRSAALYGEHDKHRFPAIIGGTLDGTFTRIGAGDTLYSHVYVGNMAHAHLRLLDALTLDAACAGQVYFITDHAPTNFFDFFVPYLDALNIDYDEQRIPAWLAYTIANLLEWRYALFPNESYAHVDLSRYTVAAVTQNCWFVHEKATRDFGYEPIFSEDEAFQRTLGWLQQTWLPRQQAAQSSDR